MFRKIAVIITCVLVLSAFAACKNKDADQTINSDSTDVTETPIAQVTEVPAGPTVTQAPLLTEGEVLQVDFTSELLSAAVVGSRPTKQINIYIPKGYNSSGKRYPVVYFFHGFGESPSFVGNAKWTFNKCMQEGKEFIVVGVDGRTIATIGSFFTNSPVTGPWEDYVIQEIVPYIDENFRTIAEPEARGIAGFSMGGYAAINLAFLHPDVFSATLAVGPGLLKDEELDLAMKLWKYDEAFLKAYSQTFAPDLNSESLGAVPKLDGSEGDDVICDKWLSGFGHLEDKVNQYLSLNTPLNKIQIIYGTSDYHEWIPNGCKYFSEILTEKGIDHTLTEVNTSHQLPAGFVDEIFVPFFTDAMNFTN